MITFAMEQHPVPQNVTSFEFHLIGDMTLKQFSYLAAGLVIAYLSFVFLLPNSSLLAVPLIALSSLIGAAFAFLPISDRPLDHWLNAFLKAVRSPTQGLWTSPLDTHQTVTPQDPVFQNRLQIYLASFQNQTPSFTPPTPSPLTLKRTTPIQTPSSITNPAGSNTTIVGSTPAENTPTNPIQNPTQQTATLAPSQQIPTPLSGSVQPLTNEDLSRLITMAQEVQFLRGKLGETEKGIKELEIKLSSSAAKTSLTPEQYQQVETALRSLHAQAEEIFQKTDQVEQQVSLKSPKFVVVESQKPSEKQLVLTSFPNVINGVVSDGNGNFIEGVIVIIYDKDHIPVRALKTNKLGQFTGSTPLPSNVYTITFEKEGFEFDTLQLTLNGEVMAPLNVVSKRLANL